MNGTVNISINVSSINSFIMNSSNPFYSPNVNDVCNFALESIHKQYELQVLQYWIFLVLGGFLLGAILTTWFFYARYAES